MVVTFDQLLAGRVRTALGIINTHAAETRINAHVTRHRNNLSSKLHPYIYAGRAPPYMRALRVLSPARGGVGVAVVSQSASRSVPGVTGTPRLYRRSVAVLVLVLVVLAVVVVVVARVPSCPMNNSRPAASVRRPDTRSIRLCK